MEKYRRKIFYSLNNDGFSLPELAIVIAIMSMLSAIAIFNFTDSRKKAFDTLALRDAMNLITVVHDNIFDDLDVDYTHNRGDGSQIGTKKTDGSARESVFILSKGVDAVSTGFSSGDTMSKIDICVFHAAGTVVGDGWLPGITDRKVFNINIDEESGDVQTSFESGV